MATVAMGFALAAPASAQLADAPEDLGTVERLTLRRAGTFEVWQDSSQLGTEFYREWVTPGRDSVISASTVRYQMSSARGSYLYQKYTLHIARANDLYPHLYQSIDLVGEHRNTVRVSTLDTAVTLLHETESGGRGTTLAIPPGKFAVLDGALYQQIESITSDFRDRPVKERTMNVLLAQRDTIVVARLSKGPRETLDLPDWGKVAADRIDLVDDWTVIRAWIDERGRMVRMDAPAQGLRVLRRVPGEDEKQAAALAKGPPLPGTKPADAR